MKHAAAALLSLLAAATVAQYASADDVVVSAGKDNTIYDEGFPVSNGAGQFIFAGNAGTGLKRRALLWFDIAKHVPAGATIQSARLQLYMSRTSVGVRQNSIHRVLSDWGEGESHASGEEGQGAPSEPGDASWIHTFFDDQFWTNPGGDFDPNPAATTDVDGIGYYNWESDELTAHVQDWLDNPSQNFGWMVIGAEPAFGGGAKRYDSRQRTGVSREGITRPKLFITFEFITPGDVTGDGFVNGADLANILTNWGECAKCAGDFNGDGVIDGADLAFLLTNWTG